MTVAADQSERGALPLVPDGAESGDAVTPELVAAYSVRTLERTVPSAVPGVCFNSGTLGEEEASLCLDAMNRIERKGPWSVTFGFSSSLQTSAVRTWAGSSDNLGAAQAALVARCAHGAAGDAAARGAVVPRARAHLPARRVLCGHHDAEEG